MTQLYNFQQQPDAGDVFVKKVAEQLGTLVAPAAPAAPKVVVALSGGADSTALLAALATLGKPAVMPGLRVFACHVNHALRAEESDADEEFCRQLCRHLDVQLKVIRLAGEVSDEAGLRNHRYAGLLETAAVFDARYIATAHTMDDQMETMLFRLFRGTAPGGLAGIPSSRTISGATIIRPLLESARVDVEAFLDRCGLPFREDSSNAQTIYQRNYIRHEIIPRVRARFPSAPQSFERLRLLVQEDERLLIELTTAAANAVVISEHRLSCSKLLAQPMSLQRRVVANCLRERGVEVTFERTNLIVELAQAGRGALCLDESWEVCVSQDELQFAQRADSGENEPLVLSGVIKQIAMSGLTLFPELNVAVQVESLMNTATAVEFPPSQSDEMLADLSTAVQPLVVRTRQPGDTIRPFGMHEKVKLKKYLHTHKSSAWINPRRHIVIADQDEVLWVPGIGVSEKIRVKQAPTHRLRFLQLGGDEGAYC